MCCGQRQDERSKDEFRGSSSTMPTRKGKPRPCIGCWWDSTVRTASWAGWSCSKSVGMGYGGDRLADQHAGAFALTAPLLGAGLSPYVFLAPGPLPIPPNSSGWPSVRQGWGPWPVSWWPG